MLVADNEKSEHGRQRRKANNGRLLHCCCICGNVDVWSDVWSCFASFEEMDNSTPYPKFCSEKCRESAGTAANNVTDEMKRKAKDAEWRDPEVVYRQANEREKYTEAARQQQRKRSFQDGHSKGG